MTSHVSTWAKRNRELKNEAARKWAAEKRAGDPKFKAEQNERSKDYYHDHKEEISAWRKTPEYREYARLSAKARRWKKAGKTVDFTIPPCPDRVGKEQRQINRIATAKNKSDKEYHEFCKKWLSGKISGAGADGKPSQFIRRYLYEKYNGSCSKCGWHEQNPVTKMVPVEIEHINGDPTDNRPENLTLYCPNCHSLTPTYRGMNRGNGRTAKGIKRNYHGEFVKAA